MATLQTTNQGAPHPHGTSDYASFYKPPPPADKLADGYIYDATLGTLLIPPPPSPGDLRAGVSSGGALGTLAVPSPAAVLAGVPTDDTIGTLEVLSEARPVPAPTNVSIFLPPPTPRGLHYA